MEILEGDHNPFDMPEGGPKGEIDDGEDESLFHDVGTSDFVERGRLEEWLAHALDLSGGGIKIKFLIFLEGCTLRII